MNQNRRPHLRFTLLAALGLALAGCNAAGGGTEAPPLAGASMGGHFTLTDQNGRRVSDAAFAGKYRIVYFGYTFCPDVCPVDMQLVGAGLRQFERDAPDRAARVVPVFITVDPARDTPEVLRHFVAAFHPRMVGLTGSAAEIDRVAHDYRIYYQRQPPGPDGSYMVDHSRMAVLYGPDGAPIATIPTDRGPEGVAGELARWVR